MIHQIAPMDRMAEPMRVPVIAIPWFLKVLPAPRSSEVEILKIPKSMKVSRRIRPMIMMIRGI